MKLLTPNFTANASAIDVVFHNQNHSNLNALGRGLFVEGAV